MTPTLEERLQLWDDDLFGKSNGQRLSMDGTTVARLWKDIAEAKNALRDKDAEIARLKQLVVNLTAELEEA
jgi:hypothetical protein